MKIKNECDLVSDLMLGYSDGVLTGTSKELVDEHIQKCNNCKEKLKNILQDLESDIQEVEIDYLKKVKNKISKKNKCLTIFGIILFIIISLNAMILVNYNMKVHEISIILQDNVTEEEKKQIEEIVQREDSEAEIIYVSKEEVAKKVQQQFAEFEVELNDTNDIFPAEYHIKTDIRHIRKIQDKLISLPCIRTFRSTADFNIYELVITEILFK